MVQRFLDLRLDGAALFLDHQQFLMTCGELDDATRLQRPTHDHLVDGHAPGCKVRVREAEVGTGLHEVLVRLANAHYAEPAFAGSDDGLVELIGARPASRRRQALVDQPTFELKPLAGPLDRRIPVQHGGDALVVWRGEWLRQCQLYDAGRLHHFGDRLHADP